MISGAGIAGLTMAYWLQKYSYVPTIVERADSLVIGGYKIDVPGTARDVLHRMGIHDAVVAASTQMRAAVLARPSGFFPFVPAMPVRRGRIADRQIGRPCGVARATAS